MPAPRLYKNFALASERAMADELSHINSPLFITHDRAITSLSVENKKRDAGTPILIIARFPSQKMTKYLFIWPKNSYHDAQ